MKAVITVMVLITSLLAGAALGDDTPPPGRITLLTLEGFMQSCTEPAIQVFENGSWRPAHRQLPAKGNYILDGRRVGYGWCDNLVCNAIDGPIRIHWVEYRRAGDRTVAGNDGGGNDSKKTYPVYQTVPLRGRVKAGIKYYTDRNCRNAKTATLELELE